MLFICVFDDYVEICECIRPGKKMFFLYSTELTLYLQPQKKKIFKMGGFFGTISKSACAIDLFYGTDYNSHLGAHRGGMATLSNGMFKRSIHNLENSYFRTRFERE